MKKIIAGLILSSAAGYIIFSFLEEYVSLECSNGYLAPVYFDGTREFYGECEPISTDAYTDCRSDSDCLHSCLFSYDDMMKFCPDVRLGNGGACPGITGSCEPIANSNPSSFTIPEPGVIDILLAD